METKATTPLHTLAARFAQTLRQAYKPGEQVDTDAMRQCAELVIDAREQFLTRDGDPDWRGQTYAYRQWYGDAFSLANVAPADTHRVQAALRYHVGNVLRERLDDEQLEALGLGTKSPRERSVDKRNREADVLRFFNGGPVLTDGEDIRKVFDFVALAVNRVSPDAARAASSDNPEAVQAAERAAAALARFLDAAGKRPAARPKRR